MHCAICEEPRPIVGRGLCGRCYVKLWRMGRLSGYPRRKWDTRKTEIERLEDRIKELEAKDGA